MPIILNIETATEICSVCISQNDKVISFAENDKGFSHASTLTILIQKCLADANITLTDIDAVAISKGPGSYTGLRIGVSVAKGICYALDKPMIAIDTLQALAWASAQEKKEQAHYCPMIDARRMEVYTSMYDLSNKEEQEVSAMIIEKNSFQSFFEKEEKIIFCGNGAEKCKPVLTSSFANFDSTICSAKNLVFLANKAFQEGEFCDVAYFSPLYYKSPNITIPKKIL